MKNDCKICALKSNAASTLNDEDLEKLSHNCVSVGFVKGDSLIKQGMLSSNVVYMRKGLAKIHITGPYYEQITRLVKAPCYLGLPTTFGDKINQYSVTAVETADVCFIDINAFRMLLGKNSNFSYEILLELCRNELDMFHKCAFRTQKQIRGNIADVLLEFADKIYESDTFILPLNQSEIGNLVDSSRESVSRVLTEFDNDGIIRVSGKKIEILNKKTLLMISANG